MLGGLAVVGRVWVCLFVASVGVLATTGSAGPAASPRVVEAAALVKIETPAPTARVFGHIVVAGWAADPAAEAGTGSSGSSRQIAVVATPTSASTLLITITGLDPGEGVTATVLAPGGSVYTQISGQANGMGVASLSVTINPGLAGTWRVIVTSSSGKGGSAGT